MMADGSLGDGSPDRGHPQARIELQARLVAVGANAPSVRRHDSPITPTLRSGYTAGTNKWEAAGLSRGLHQAFVISVPDGGPLSPCTLEQRSMNRVPYGNKVP
jgi:hypothetical protein